LPLALPDVRREPDRAPVFAKAALNRLANPEVA